MKRISRRKSVWKTLLYVLVVVLLLAGLFFLFQRERQQKAERWKQQKDLMMNETAPVSAKASTAPKEEKLFEEMVSVEDLKPTETPIPEVSPASTPESEDSMTPVEDSIRTDIIPNVQDQTILILNGTRIPGVAAYWKQQFEATGFNDVEIASYKIFPGAKTEIYGLKETQASEELKKLFPEAVYKEGVVTDGIEFDSNVDAQEKEYDIYIVVGSSDAKNK